MTNAELEYAVEVGTGEGPFIGYNTKTGTYAGVGVNFGLVDVGISASMYALNQIKEGEIPEGSISKSYGIGVFGGVEYSRTNQEDTELSVFGGIGVPGLANVRVQSNHVGNDLFDLGTKILAHEMYLAAEVAIAMSSGTKDHRCDSFMYCTM